MNKAVLTGVIVAFIAVVAIFAGCTTFTSQNNTAQELPIANAGADQKVKAGSVVTLDGSASSAPRGGALAYDWSFNSVPNNSSAQLANQTSDQPTFKPDKTGIYVVILAVTDSVGAKSTPDTTNITVIPAERSNSTLTVTFSEKTDLYLGDQGPISGRLVDAEGNGIPNQTIKFKNVARVLGFTYESPMTNTTTDSTGAFTVLSDPISRQDAPFFITEVDVEQWAIYEGNDLYKPAESPHTHLTVHLTSPPTS